MSPHDVKDRPDGREPLTQLPPADLDQMLDLARFLERISEPAALLGPDGQTVALPIEVYDVLTQVVTAMQSGKAITVAPTDQILTTQESADFLGISRPTLVKLLERGDIPYEQPGLGRHRRVRLADLLTYRDSIRLQRRAALREMTREASANGMYDERIEDYRAALAEARRRN